MKRVFLPFLTLQFMIISCSYNLCIDEPEDWRPPIVRSVMFSPKTAKVGDTIMMVIEKDSWNCTANLDYNTDFEITENGEIKYIGTHSDINHNFAKDESRRIMSPITYICLQKEYNETDIAVTEYVSIKGFQKSTEKRRDVVVIEFKVPKNAKSGYIRTTEPMGFAWFGFSEEKLIIIDENGKEITEYAALQKQRRIFDY